MSDVFERLRMPERVIESKCDHPHGFKEDSRFVCLDCNRTHREIELIGYCESLQAEVDRLQSELSESVKNGENLHLEVERLATYAKAIDEREPDSSGYALREIGMCYEEFDMLLRKAQKEGSE